MNSQLIFYLLLMPNLRWLIAVAVLMSRYMSSICSRRGSRLMLLGGEPFEENIVMWWNFVGRSHEEILGFRGDWEQHERFADVPGWGGTRLDAPPVPVGQLKARSRGR